jgi:hypothetical protein
MPRSCGGEVLALTSVHLQRCHLLDVPSVATRPKSLQTTG